MDRRAQANETDRLLGELIKLGRVVTVNLAVGRCVVELGDEDEAMPTGPIPWQTLRAGETTVWAPPSVGEQVSVHLPEGDIERAYVSGALFSDENPPAATDGRTLIGFADGAFISYDPAAHALDVDLPAGGSITLTADAGVTIAGPVNITGPVDITGDVAVTGELTATVDVKAAGKSLKTHKHSGVQTGAGQTGAPV